MNKRNKWAAINVLDQYNTIIDTIKLDTNGKIMRKLKRQKRRNLQVNQKFEYSSELALVEGNKEMETLPNGTSEFESELEKLANNILKLTNEGTQPGPLNDYVFKPIMQKNNLIDTVNGDSIESLTHGNHFQPDEPGDMNIMFPSFTDQLFDQNLSFENFQNIFGM